MSERLLTVVDVAELVQLGCESVRRAARRGDLQAVRIGGRLRFHQHAVDAWIEASASAAALPQGRPAGRVEHLMERHRPAA